MRIAQYPFRQGKRRLNFGLRLVPEPRFELVAGSIQMVRSVSRVIPSPSSMTSMEPLPGSKGPLKRIVTSFASASYAFFTSSMMATISLLMSSLPSVRSNLARGRSGMPVSLCFATDQVCLCV